MGSNPESAKVAPPLRKMYGRESGVGKKLLKLAPPGQRVPDDFDRYRDYYLAGKKLPPVMEKKAHMMRAVFNLLCEGYQVSHIEKVLEDQYQVSETASYRVIADAKAIFGDVMSHNKEGERVILRHRLEKLHDEATDPNVKLEIFKLMAKLLGLLEKDPDQKLDVTKLNLTAQILFTSDPNVLHAPAIEETPFTEI
jgi:hypothetical protein